VLFCGRKEGVNYSAVELLLAYEERLVAWQHCMFLSDFIQTSFESILSVVHYSENADFFQNTRPGVNKSPLPVR